MVLEASPIATEHNFKGIKQQKASEKIRRERASPGPIKGQGAGQARDQEGAELRFAGIWSRRDQRTSGVPSPLV